MYLKNIRSLQNGGSSLHYAALNTSWGVRDGGFAEAEELGQKDLPVENKASQNTTI